VAKRRGCYETFNSNSAIITIQNADMGKTKELFMQYQEENNNLDWVNHMQYVECNLSENESGLTKDSQPSKSNISNDMDSILQFFDKISEN
jgi:hypothetical protein